MHFWIKTNELVLPPPLTAGNAVVSSMLSRGFQHFMEITANHLIAKFILWFDGGLIKEISWSSER